MCWYYSELLHLKIKVKPFYFQSEFIEAWASNCSAGHPVLPQPGEGMRLFLPLSLRGFPTTSHFSKGTGMSRGNEESDLRREHMCGLTSTFSSSHCLRACAPSSSDFCRMACTGVLSSGQGRQEPANSEKGRVNRKAVQRASHFIGTPRSLGSVCIPAVWMAEQKPPTRVVQVGWAPGLMENTFPARDCISTMCYSVLFYRNCHSTLFEATP